jgi:phasin family protein
MRKRVFSGTKKMKSAEQFISFGQGKQMAANAQAAMDESMSTFRAMSGVRSIKEAFEMQANFARSSVEKVMSQTGQFTEASMKLAGQAYEPIAGRVTVAVESFRAA